MGYRILSSIAAAAAVVWATISAGPHPLMATPLAQAAGGTEAPGGWAVPAEAQALVQEALSAWKRRDRTKLASLRDQARQARSPFLAWIEYWELNARLPEAKQDELNAFYGRFAGSYQEDRLRNDWLLELGRRRDWENFQKDLKSYRMNDDREVACYALLAEWAGQQRTDSPQYAHRAREAWFAQKEADNGCGTMALTLMEAGVMHWGDAWRKARVAAEAGKKAAALQAANLIHPDAAKWLGEFWDKPQAYLKTHARATNRTDQELVALALIRLAAKDYKSPVDTRMAAALLASDWEAKLPRDLVSWVWASIGKHGGLRQLPEAGEWFQKAAKGAHEIDWSDDTLAWKVRVALRANVAEVRWDVVQRALDAMSAAEQREPAWMYWRARAYLASGRTSRQADAQRLLEAIATPQTFYGKLALEELGRGLAWPDRSIQLTSEERSKVRQHEGLQRSLAMIQAGLRAEGVREWNFHAIGQGDRHLLAMAELACERGVWDRCINTSERTREVWSLAQRYPMPHGDVLKARAQEAGLDPATVFGLVRQESRFQADAQSYVGATGLMQLMPETARWMARKVGVPYQPERLVDPDYNARLGTAYLKLLLDDFEGNLAMAAAAYNAGPGRPRRWRDGPAVDAAAWVEGIPFNETRDYVKKVVSNSVDYAQLMQQAQGTSLKARLGATIGPRAAQAAAANPDLP